MVSVKMETCQNGQNATAAAAAADEKGEEGDMRGGMERDGKGREWEEGLRRRGVRMKASNGGKRFCPPTFKELPPSTHAVHCLYLH